MSVIWVVLAALLGLVFSLATMPLLIRALKKRGFLAQDMYKAGTVIVPTNGGLIVLFGCFMVLLVFPAMMYALWLMNKHWLEIPWMMKEQISLLPLAQMGVLVVAIYGLYGLIDDYLKMQTTLLSRILLPLLFAIPLIEPLYYITIKVPIFGTVDNSSVITILGAEIKMINFYRYIIAPLYIMIVANLFNRHSGYNGLQSGLSAIVLFFVIAKCATLGKNAEMLGLAAILGTCVGFWWFNKYPSEVFSGNVGSYVMGAAVGVGIITGGFLLAGFVMLIPHVADIGLSFYAWARRIKIKKFGKIRKDGTIRVPCNLTLKYLLPYYFRMTERRATNLLYAITIAFCCIGMLLPF